VFKLWRSKTRTVAAEASSIGDCAAYAIGDIHGRIDLLNLLLERIREDIATRSMLERPLLIFLGDYVDRGPASREVIEQIMALRSSYTVVSLRGNHEDALLRFLTDPTIGPDWVEHGGAQTLLSYGVQPPQKADPVPWADVRDRFADALPDSHLAFFQGLEHYAVIGDYVFAHAGVRPAVALEQQTTQDLMWIRKPFLEVEKAIDRVVVHGHTPADTPHMGRWRIGVDTGAYATGVLTAVRLMGTDRAFLSTRPTPLLPDSVGQ
jgi:serine/threonine protein phosphatase 1